MKTKLSNILKWTAIVAVMLMANAIFTPLVAQVYTAYAALDGNVSSPSYAFNSATNTGLSRDAGSGGAQVSTSGSLVQRWLAAGAVLAGQTRYGLSGTPAINACGTATVTGTDSAFQVVITAGTPSTCTVNFAATWAAAPNCYYTDKTTAGAQGGKVTTTTALVNLIIATTFTGQSANFGADTLAVHCESN